MANPQAASLEAVNHDARRRSICKKTAARRRPFGKNEYFQSLRKPRIAGLSEFFTADDAYKAYSDAQGIDLSIGRRTHSLFRAAGVVDIHVDAIMHVFAAGEPGRMILRDFVNNAREKLVEQGFIGQTDFENDMAALERHLSNPEVLVTSHLFYRLTGRLPQSS